jgi:hypothetical protein
MPPINWAGVLVAWIAAWLLQGICYAVLGRIWTKALGWTAADLRGPDGRRRMPLGPMILSLAAELLMALMLAGIIGHLGGPNVTIGAISGVLVWLGFVVTTISVNNAFQRRSLTLTVIDAGIWLAVLVVQGLIIGLFG